LAAEIGITRDASDGEFQRLGMPGRIQTPSDFTAECALALEHLRNAHDLGAHEQTRAKVRRLIRLAAALIDEEMSRQRH
jgi:hypothetical protein